MSLRVTSQTARAAAASLLEQGLNLPEKPEEESIPFIPVDISTVEDGDLMSLFAELTAWCDYANTQLALAKVAEREAEKLQSRTEAKYMAAQGIGKGERVTAVKAQVAAMPEVIRAAQAVDTAYAYRSLTESIYENLERDIALVSRELTRRTANGNTNYRKRSATA